MSVAENGVYWPFKNFLTGSGIVITETPTTITIGTTGAGPGGGDMLSSVYATNGAPGVVDKALSAQTVTGVVAHATLADSVPWGGITGAPTVFPSDWNSITNKPATFAPTPHGFTHVGTGTDPVPVATTSSSGLLPKLSGKTTDIIGGDGTWRDLNTTVGSYPLTMSAAGPLTCNAAVTCNKGLNVIGPSGLSLTKAANLTINAGVWQVINPPATAETGVMDPTGNNCEIDFCTSTKWGFDDIAIAKSPNDPNLYYAYAPASGGWANQQYNGQVMVTSCPSGTYSMRAGTMIVGTADVPGDATAYYNASLQVQSASNGGFAAVGMVCNNFWGCALGAFQSGLYIATTDNTFVQLTDYTGHIVAGALAAGVIQGSLGYTPVNQAGDTMSGRLVVGSGNQNVQLIPNQGIYVSGDYGQGFGALGQISIFAAGGNTRAGIRFQTLNGWVFSLFALDNGHFYAYCQNNGATAQLV